MLPSSTGEITYFVPFSSTCEVLLSFSPFSILTEGIPGSQRLFQLLLKGSSARDPLGAEQAECNPQHGRAKSKTKQNKIKIRNKNPCPCKSEF